MYGLRHHTDLYGVGDHTPLLDFLIMPQEKSAGAIIYRMEDGEPRYLLLHYYSGHWDFSRGHIEENENPKQTVKREVEEETRIKNIKILSGFEGHTKFFFKRAHDLPPEERKKAPWIIKLITLYIAKTNKKKIIISSEQKGFGWFGYQEALKKLAPHGKQVFKEAHKFILKYEKPNRV